MAHLKLIHSQDVSYNLTLMLEQYLENDCCFRDYEILPRKNFGKVNKVAVHQLVEFDSLEQDVDNAIYNFQRDGFGSIIFYI